VKYTLPQTAYDEVGNKIMGAGHRREGSFEAEVKAKRLAVWLL
jgi:hypothetical protein